MKPNIQFLLIVFSMAVYLCTFSFNVWGAFTIIPTFSLAKGDPEKQLVLVKCYDQADPQGKSSIDVTREGSYRLTCPPGKYASGTEYGTYDIVLNITAPAQSTGPLTCRDGNSAFYLGPTEDRKHDVFTCSR